MILEKIMYVRICVSESVANKIKLQWDQKIYQIRLEQKTLEQLREESGKTLELGET